MYCECEYIDGEKADDEAITRREKTYKKAALFKKRRLPVAQRVNHTLDSWFNWTLGSGGHLVQVLCSGGHFVHVDTLFRWWTLGSGGGHLVQVVDTWFRWTLCSGGHLVQVDPWFNWTLGSGGHWVQVVGTLSRLTPFCSGGHRVV